MAPPEQGTGHRCTPPAGVATRAVLRLLNGAEPAQALCRQLRVCRRCLDDWCSTFLTHGVRALAQGAATGADVEEVLAQDLAELRRVLREARQEWELWDRLAAASRTCSQVPAE
ncbi:helix-turn-helix domain-containing protein [Streptomyces sp. NPDC008222]|uniref:helix-turn-helix domain-containing protein n=1 Tax=Streptomyces sp. NPDC008222 TaxID=3364820 RepID=UPI0036E4025F